MRWVKRIAANLLGVLLTIILGVFVSATLVRFAPGFDADEHQLDSRLQSDTVAALKAAKTANSHLLPFYATYFSHALHGDLGVSSTLGRPVRELIVERYPQTLRVCALGLALGCLLGFFLACVSALPGSAAWDVTTASVAGLLLCLPASVVALACLFAKIPAGVAIAAVILPRVYRYSRNLLLRAYALPHVTAAVARGIAPLRIFLWHVLPVCAPQLAAVFGISVSLALSAAIPIESLCGVSGIGQLAWQAALGRDLPVLVTLTVVLASITIFSNSLSTSLRLGGDAA